MLNLTAEILKDDNADEEFKEMAREEATEGEERITHLEKEMMLMLLPTDPLDEKNIMLEVSGQLYPAI